MATLKPDTTPETEVAEDSPPAEVEESEFRSYEELPQWLRDEAETRERNTLDRFVESHDRRHKKVIAISALTPILTYLLFGTMVGACAATIVIFVLARRRAEVLTISAAYSFAVFFGLAMGTLSPAFTIMSLLTLPLVPLTGYALGAAVRYDFTLD